MKPNEIAKLFSEFIEEGTTAKGVKVKSFFNGLPDSQKRIVANNIAKAYATYQEEEKAKADLRKRKKKEIAELKRKAKELGLTISE
jgi:TRAP-type mannitol/chloroaromatic compound transport system substrate-binding protein